MITVTQAKKALKNHSIKILGTKLEELKTKNPVKHQIFYNTCVLLSCAYTFLIMKIKLYVKQIGLT